ncbi:MAG TPA: hypothetical protein VHC18_08135 [Amycolatopsis sp.]|nr:hypothetical protein [Amycolatopsis sp.]
MTIDVPIRPGAALNDPETYRYVEDEILNKQYNALDRRVGTPELVYNKDSFLNVLANYPWQEYGYKYGRWQREGVFEGTNLDFIPLKWMSWERRYFTVLLTHPANGQPVAEVAGAGLRIDGPAGKLLFAGDPHYAGILNVVTHGRRHMSVVGSPRLAPSEKDRHGPIAGPANKVAQGLVPGRRPQVRLFEPDPAWASRLGPWIADQPKRPPKPGKR